MTNRVCFTSAVILFLISLGCASPDWQLTARIGEFEFKTTAPPPSNLEALNLFLDRYDRLRNLFEAKGRSAEPVLVEYLHDEGRDLESSGRNFMFTFKPPKDYVICNMEGKVKRIFFDYQFSEGMLFHELTHYILLIEFPEQITNDWLHEGLAKWMELGAAPDDGDSLSLKPYGELEELLNSLADPQICPLGHIFHEGSGGNSWMPYRAAALCSYALDPSRGGTFRQRLENLIAADKEELLKIEKEAVGSG